MISEKTGREIPAMAVIEAPRIDNAPDYGGSEATSTDSIQYLPSLLWSQKVDTDDIEQYEMTLSDSKKHLSNWVNWKPKSK